MFGSTLLDVLIGIVLIYFVLSLACSAAVEAISGMARSRARNFKTAICNLIAEDPAALAASVSDEMTDAALKALQNVFTAVRNRFRKTNGLAPATNEVLEAPPGASAAQVKADATQNVFLKTFKAHPLVASISGQKIGKIFKADAGWPSYMHARTFGSVLLDILSPKQLPVNQRRTFWALRAALVAPETLPSLPATGQSVPVQTNLGKNLRSILTSFVEVAEAHVPDDAEDADAGRLNVFRSQIEAWFDEGMERAAGWYKQNVQWYLLLIGLVFSFALNVDTIQIVTQLFKDPAARSGLVALAQKQVTAGPTTGPALSQDVVTKWEGVESAGIPVGWHHRPTSAGAFSLAGVTKIGGLLLTTLAVSLGAPFWFDMLNKLVNVRATGARPEQSGAGLALDDLFSASSSSVDDNTNQATPTTALTSAANVILASTAVAQPVGALILPSNYWSMPIRVRDLTAFDPQAAGYTPGNAALMARASLLAYQDEQQIRQTLTTAWKVSPNDIAVFSVDDEQAFVTIVKDTVILAFRGTVPQRLNTILADAGICLVDCSFVKGVGKVHCGFLGALTKLQVDIDAFLAKRISLPLFITGHSLGAAMGTLYAAARVWSDPAQSVAGLYTFGSPRVGDQKFVSALDSELPIKSFRLINEEDLVTRVAPRELNYDHLNAPMFLDASGQLETTGIGWSRFLNSAVNALNDFKVEAQTSIYDHHIELYVRKLDNLATR